MKIPDATNAELKRQGKTASQITSMVLAEVADLEQARSDARVDHRRGNAKKGTYSAYFGLVSDLGNKRSVPMTPSAGHVSVSRRCPSDPRITADLLNV